MAWRSLGTAMHYQTHLRLQLAEDPNFPLPGVVSSWPIDPGLKRGTTTYPPPSLVDAIDRRSGASDLQVEIERQRALEVQRLGLALRTLRE